ncbi:TolC family protein [Pseudomonas viridiflava]|uniref:TolC family protein n=1 Tax=Pseudomonas viridiflava TaxID=33069 RepID=UPI0015E33AA5|nr:TolC family protein [Pseudomonas viridiflava]
MTKSILFLCVAICSVKVHAMQALAPSEATMPQQRSVTLSQEMINLTLADAVFLGLRNNRSIKSAYLGRLAQKFDLRVSEDIFTPKLVLSGSYLASRNQSDRYRQSQVAPTATMLGEFGTRFSLSWNNQLTTANAAGRAGNDGTTFTIIQPLLRGAGRDVATAPVRLARLSELINRLSLKSTVSQTVTQVITAYRDLLRAQEQLRIAQDALARSRQLLEVNQAMIDAGRMAAFEIVQTEADVASQELGTEEAANQLDSSRLELLRLLALNQETRVLAVESLEARRMELSRSQAMKTALEQQPDYLGQLIANKQASINLLVARNDRLWDVSLVGGASQVSNFYTDVQGRDSDRRWEGYAGVQVEIPIGDLSRKQNAVRAQVNVEDQELLLTEARQILERDVGDAVRNIGTRWRQYEISIRARDLSRRKLEIERDKLQVGRSSNFQVLSFEADLRNAESASVDALIAYLNAKTQLDQTLGTTLESWDIALND